MTPVRAAAALLALLFLAFAFVGLRLPAKGDFAGAPLLRAAGVVTDPAASVWKSEPFAADPARPLVLIEATIRGHHRLQAYFEDASNPARRTRPLGLDRGPEPEAWQGTLGVPAPASRLVLDWSGNPEGKPVVDTLLLRPLDPRFYGRHRLVVLLRAASVAAALWVLLGFLRRRLPPEGFRNAVWRGLLPVALVAFLAWGLGARYAPGTGPHGMPYAFSGLIDMGWDAYRHATARAKEVDFKVNTFAGYDGAGYVQIALDPLLTDRQGLKAAMGLPDYRGRRILLPGLAAILGLGKPFWVVEVLALLNAAFWLGLLALLIRAFPKPGPEQGAVLVGTLLATGTLESVTRSLGDFPSAALLLAAVAAAPARDGKAPLAWGLAVLSRETSVLGFGAATAVLPFGRIREGLRRIPAAWWIGLGIAVLLVGGWFAYVRHCFLHYRSSGGTDHNIGLPFVDLVGRFAKVRTLGGWLDRNNWQAFLSAFGLLVQGAYLLRHPRPDAAGWRMGVPFLILLAILGDFVWDGRTPSALRVLLPLTFAFHWELGQSGRTGWAFWRWWVPANLTLWPGVVNFLFPR